MTRLLTRFRRWLSDRSLKHVIVTNGRWHLGKPQCAACGVWLCWNGAEESRCRREDRESWQRRVTVKDGQLVEVLTGRVVG